MRTPAHTVTPAAPNVTPGIVDKVPGQARNTTRPADREE